MGALRAFFAGVRAAFALSCFAVAFVASLVLGFTIFDSLWWGPVLWCIFMALSVRQFLVSVPEVTGLVTINLLTGNLVSYGTGMHFRFPWEQVKEGNYLNLRLETVEKEETYPSSDGPMMLVKWSYQYRPLADRLDRYIASDDSTIKEGLGSVGSSVLSAIISQIDADDCKAHQQDIELELIEQFNTIDPASLYGIELIKVALADVDFEERVQKVRASQIVAKKLEEIATKIKIAHPKISDKDAMNAAMIINGDITKTVTEVEGEGGQALAALLIAMSGGGKGGKK